MEIGFTIITGGDFSMIEDMPEGDFVIACDKGYGYARRWSSVILIPAPPLPDTAYR